MFQPPSIGSPQRRRRRPLKKTAFPSAASRRALAGVVTLMRARCARGEGETCASVLNATKPDRTIVLEYNRRDCTNSMMRCGPRAGRIGSRWARAGVFAADSLKFKEAIPDPVVFGPQP